MQRFLNAYWINNTITTFRRDENGTLVKEMIKGEHVLFLKASDCSSEFLREISNSRYCLGYCVEGDWIRVKCKDRDACEKIAIYCKKIAKIPTFEADVNPVKRWMIEKDIHIQRPRIVFLDFESDSRVPFKKLAQARILIAGLVDEQGRSLKLVLAEDTDEAEIALLKKLIKALDSFDLVCAWNGDRFDFELLKARLQRFQIKFDLRRFLWLDHMVLFKRLNTAAESGDEKQSMSLESVGQYVLGEGKLEGISGSMSWDLWNEGGEKREMLATYCVRDADLMRKIEAKTGFIELFFTLADATCVFPDSRGLKPTAQVDSFLLRLGRDRGMHFPSHFFDEEETKEKFAGAYVQEPNVVGIGKNVHVCDFASLYPSIILTWNMSPDTYCENIRLEESDFRPSYLMHLPRKRFPIPEGHCAAPKTDCVFKNEPRGLLPLALEEMLRLRKYWNDQKASLPPGTTEWVDADRKTTAYKVAANSFYGVVGSNLSRHFRREVAESTSQSGVWLIQKTIAEVESGEWRKEVGLEPAKTKVTAQSVYSDSISSDRTVIVRDPSEKTFILTVEELFEKASEIVVDRGKEFGRFAEGWKALARGEDGDGWYPLKNVLRHRTDKELVKISTKVGQTEVTVDHSIVVAGECVTPEQFLDRELEFDVVKAQPARFLKEVDLWEFLKDASFTTKYKGRDLHYDFKLSEDGEWIEQNSGWKHRKLERIKRRYDVKSAEFESLLRFLGAYLSEGSCSIRGLTAGRWMTRIVAADSSWLEELRCDVTRFTEGVTFSKPKWSSSAVHYIQTGTAFFTQVIAALCGFKSRGKRLPEFVYDIQYDYLVPLLRVYLEGDGYVSGESILYSTTSQKLIAGLSYVFDQHSIDHSIFWRPSKEEYTFRSRMKSQRARRVVKVERRQCDGFVYDLTVEGAHTFVDGVGRVLLHNTDSAFVSNITEEDFSAFVEWCNSTLYKRVLKEFGISEERVRIKLAYEKAFKRIVFVSKKRYAGKYLHYKGKRARADSKPEVKGLEYKRGDTAKLAREMQQEAIDLIITKEVDDPQELHALVLRWMERVLAGELTLDDVKISKYLRKELNDYASRTKKDGTDSQAMPQVVVARILEKRGCDVGEGVKIAYVVVKSDPLVVVPVDDYKGEVDRTYLWETLVYPPTERFLQAAFPKEDWAIYGRAEARSQEWRDRFQEEKSLMELKAIERHSLGKSKTLRMPSIKAVASKLKTQISEQGKLF